ncbi:TRAP transporter small permease [Chungangia koreensis]|uniref:TRAP transporter small permease n=1 Tax=Chungangia koreensis TaxID=752657 RepID=A0ABV8X2F2_9LACT
MILEKADHWITKLLEFIITVCLSVTVILTLVQVIFRFVLKMSLSWSQEVVMISFVYSVLFGAALAFKNSEHLTVDIFENAKPIVQKIFNVISFTAVAIMIVVLIVYGFQLVADNLASGQIVGFLPIKKGYVYLALPLSAIFMLYYHVKRVIPWRG